jgi:integrase
VLLAAFQGLRCGEIARLSRDDVTVEWLPVLRKGGKTQLLPTHPLVFAELSALPPGPAVPRTRGGHFRPKGLAIAASRQLTRAGLPDLTLHWFRHRFATMSLLPKDLGGAGADVRTVQELLGHESLASTQVYTRVTDTQRRAAVLALPVPVA